MNVDVSDMLDRSGWDVFAVAAARGYVLAPWGLGRTELRGRVICYPERASAREQEEAVLTVLFDAEGEDDGRASRVRCVSAG